MTSRTRGRLTVAVVLGLLTLPAEAILLPVARTPDVAVAALDWSADLSPTALKEASLEIDAYPLAYRRAIMTRLAPEDRSDAWQEHVRRYLRTHAKLSPAQVSVLQDALEVLSPEAFAPPVSPDVKEQISKIFNQAIVVLGPKAADELFVTLGPKKLERANALPWRQQLADRVRGWRNVSAEYPDCNCNIDIDTCDLEPDPWLQCSELYTCNFDLNWPMCGPVWAWACTGWCKILRWPDPLY